MSSPPHPFRPHFQGFVRTRKDERPFGSSIETLSFNYLDILPSVEIVFGSDHRTVYEGVAHSQTSFLSHDLWDLLLMFVADAKNRTGRADFLPGLSLSLTALVFGRSTADYCTGPKIGETMISICPPLPTTCRRTFS